MHPEAPPYAAPRGLLRRLWAPRRPEPSYPALPAVRDDGQSSVPGIYLAGELAGTPLVKLNLNAGVDVAERIARDLHGGDPGVLDLVIVGAGAAGLAAAVRAQELGLTTLTLDAQHWAQTVVDMYKGKLLFAEPEGVELRSSLWFEECRREELLDRWRSQLSDLGLRVHEHEPVTAVRGKRDAFEVVTEHARYRARRVLLALGKAGNPRKAGVPGEQEHGARVSHSLRDPDAVRDQDVFIYGGGDVAAEAALSLCERNRVTLVTIDPALTHPKRRNREALEERVGAGAISLHLSSRLEAIEAGAVRFTDAEGRTRRVANDLVLEMIGAELPLGFLRRTGVRLEGRFGPGRWTVLAGVFAAVYTLYALKKFPEEPYAWPFTGFIDPDAFRRTTGAVFDIAFAPFGWLFDGPARAQIGQTLWFQQGYLYSLAYTIVMVVFGAQALRRWSNIAHDPRYQKWRYLTLIAFQVGFFLIANVVAVQALSIQHAWRAWGLYQPWPLFFHTFHWLQASDPRVVLYGFVGAGLFATFVAIPWAAHRHGKRFCTWICGCGGLAETLGDRWRHLSPKGERSRAWEFQSVLVLAAATLVTLVTVGAYQTRANNEWALAYSYVVDFWLVAVIPIALYPFFGGKVWCRYWCPLAAYNGLLARWYGKLEIRANDRCINCTLCSRHCQVGVDVMAFAKNQEAFDNRNSSCIQCGICIDVCPMQVLSFDQRDRRRLPVVG